MKPEHLQVVSALRFIERLVEQIVQPLRQVAQLLAIGIIREPLGMPAHRLSVNGAIAGIEGGEIGPGATQIDKGIAFRWGQHSGFPIEKYELT